MSTENAPITYELRTLNDIFEKVPADRIQDCCRELGIGLAQMKATLELFLAGAEALGISPEALGFQMPDHHTWVDDGMGDISVKVHAASDPEGERLPLFEINTKLEGEQP